MRIKDFLGRLYYRFLLLFVRDSSLANLIKYYSECRPNGGRRVTLMNTLSQTETQTKALEFHGFWDFASQPYALGDILTWGVDLTTKAIEVGKRDVVLHVLADPTRPASINQPYVHPYNYQGYYLDMLAAFYAIPNVRDIHFYQSRDTFERVLIESEMNGCAHSQNLLEYSAGLNTQPIYKGVFTNINQFYRQHGYVPKLTKLSAEPVLTDNHQFLTHADTKFVVVHIRQRKNASGTLFKGDLGRDSVTEDWIAFFKWAEQNASHIVFLVIGTGKEYSKHYAQCRNVHFVKHYGFGLREELTLIMEADLFLGANSGPAMAAMLSDVPYLIFVNNGNHEYTKQLLELNEGENQLIFANDKQKFVWQSATKDALIEHFQTMLTQLD